MSAKVVIWVMCVSRVLAQNGFQFGDGFYNFVRTTQRPTTPRTVWNQNYIDNQQNFAGNQFQNPNSFGSQFQNPGSFGSLFQDPNSFGNQFPHQSSFSNQFPNRDNFGNQFPNQYPAENQFQKQNTFGSQTTSLYPIQENRFQNQNTRGSTEENHSWNFKPDSTCQAVDNTIGSCINIKSCQPFLAVLRNVRTNPQAADTLRRSHCGFEGNDPKVCCPNTQPIPTAPPTVLEPQTPKPKTEAPQTQAPPPSTETPKSPQTPEPQESKTHEPVIDGSADDVDSISQFVESLPEPPVCGVSNNTFSRVVGGVKANLGAFPWMALLGYHSQRNPGQARWLCGGSLVTSKHVLTAAHCIHGREKDLYLVRLGELDLSRDDDGATPIDIPIRQKIKHEDYSAKAFTNDIGVLVLERDVHFTDLIRPICLPRSARMRALTFERYTPFIAGWGDTEFRGPSASHLQVLQLPVVSNAFCANAYKAYKAQTIDERVLCAGYEKGGKDACQGDSGGPLMQPDYNRETHKTYLYQIGVVSFGRKCAEAGYPGVYTRTTYFMPWLYKQLVGQNLH